MAASDRLTGSDLVVTFTPVADSEYTITGNQTSLSFDRQLDTADVTAGNELARYQKPTIESLEWTLMIFDANPTDTYETKILPRKEGLLKIYKRGVGAGKPIMSFNTLINSYTEDFPFDGALEIEISGVRQGVMVNETGSVQP